VGIPGITNLGGDNKLDVAGLSGKILVAIAAGAAEQDAGILPDEIIGPLSGALLDEGGKI
jgi:hypothetical protein